MNPLAKLDQKFVWHPFTQMRDWLKREPIVITEGKGTVLRDAKGREYLDANSSIWTNLHGHQHPKINAAITRQLKKISHSSALGFANEPASLLAEKLVSAANSKLVGRASSRADLKTFQAALNHVCLELAKKIVRDGEGVHRVVTVRVNGAKTIQDADAAARAVANSALVKTSWHGGDPNWGRIIDAIGYSSATVVEEKIDIGYSATGSKKILRSLKRGQPTKATFKQLCAAVAPKEFELHINLNLGDANAVMYAADLTEAYVDYNKGDVTDPTTLGG